MRSSNKGLFAALLLAAAPAVVMAQNVAPAPAPPPPSMDDPGQPATAESIRPDDPRLAPLPPESAPEPAARKNAPKGHEKSDGDPTNVPTMPTDDAFHPPPKKVDEVQSADGYTVRSYTTSKGDHIEEYRHGGQLTEVRVKPSNGPAFLLKDTNADGRINRGDANKTTPVQWSLFEWH
jgi:hypothetical protein